MTATLPRLSGACGLLLTALTAPLALQAAPLSTIQTNKVQITGVPLATIDDTNVAFFAAAEAAEAARDTTFTVNGTEFTISAYGYASPEALRAATLLSATAGGATANHLHFVNAAVTDGLRIDSSLYDGQLARVTYQLDVSGVLGTATEGDGFPIVSANARWRVSSGCAVANQCTSGWIGSAPAYEGSMQSTLPGTLFTAGDAPGVLEFTVEAAFGLELLITTVLEVSSQLTFGNGTAGVVATAAADFSHTVLWGGIKSVSLLDGTVVTDWTTVSGSGFDYGSASVVPLPGAVWLFGSALLGLGLARRQRVSR